MVRTHFWGLFGLALFSSTLFACGLTSHVPGTDPSDAAAEETTNDTGSTPDDNSSSDGNTDNGNNNGDGTTDPGPVDSTCPEAEHFLDVSQFDGAGAAYPDPELNAYCTETTLVVESNGIPHYEFQQTTPNALQAQNYNFQMPRNPQLAAGKTEIPLLGTIGVAVNGIPFFGPNEAGNLDWGDPVVDNILDWCHGHTGMGGTYHYHAALVECLTQDMSETQPSPVVGYSLDGFPIYGPYGCVDAGCTDVMKFESSWETTGEATAAWDNNVYVEKSGDQYLDECNGRIGPDGTYRYHLTDTFPYILGCYSGTAQSGGGGQTDPGGGTGDTGAPDDGGAGGPPTCVEESDCVDQCPPGSIGCTCHETPMGENICVPECSSDSDCPEGPMGQLICNTNQGVCVPEGGPGGQP